MPTLLQASSSPSYSQTTFFIAEQLPVLPRSTFSATDLAFIVPRVLELTYTSHLMKPFAYDLDCTRNTPFPWDEDRRALLSAELDAKTAKMKRGELT